jgi:hypothetical protein
MRNSRKLITFSLVILLCMSLLPLSSASGDSAPIAENLDLETYRGVSVGGQLTAIDPQGKTLTFEITTEPTKGTVELSTDGSFTYTPEEGKKGRDYFGFKAVNADGISSQEATVLIKINKQKSNVCYSDLSGSPYEYAAVFLAESGIYTGISTGGQYLFEPETAVTRGEFLAMCMQLSGEEILTGVMSTGFSDDSTIPDWMKPYISTALMTGAIQGYSSDSGAVFRANDPIGYYEAAVMLDKILGTSNVVTTGRFDTGVAPTWAAQSISNLSACRVLSVGEPVSVDSTLTMAQAASMLTAAYHTYIAPK